MKVDEYLWLTTAPNPRSRDTGFDAGQRGWRLHAIRGKESETCEELHCRPAICGLEPAHGWGLDLFIDQKCARCEAALARKEKKENK